MLRQISRAALLGALALGAAGCNSFLTGPGLDQDPNNPTSQLGTATRLFTGVQAAQFLNYTNTTSLIICVWVQQCGATNARFLENQGVGYIFTNSSFNGDWASVYVGGGLVDLRAIQAQADSAGDRVFLGIAQVWEAIVVSEAADKWGDIVYSEAVTATIEQPRLDNQLDVYTALQALLDQAIANLNSGTGNGPGANDLVYGGDAARWVRLANTLKARIALHTVGATATGAAAGNAVYTQVAQFAAQGINSAAGDFEAVFSGAGANQSNPWFQFVAASGFGPDLTVGTFLINLMAARSDPRRTAYFGTTTPAPGDPIGPARLAADFAQPWITYQETLLIRAEAELLRPGGGVSAAQPFYAQYRSAAGLPTATLPGTIPAALTEIMTEKYIALFQNYESWNDYKRTCLPALTPSAAVSSFGNRIPARLYYSSSEQQNNPTNIPSAAQQISGGYNGGTPAIPSGFRNRNHQRAC